VIQFRHIILPARAEALLHDLATTLPTDRSAAARVRDALGPQGVVFEPPLGGQGYQPTDLLALARHGLVDLARAGTGDWRALVTALGRAYHEDTAMPPLDRPPVQ
jgi:hypothetical protein